MLRVVLCTTAVVLCISGPAFGCADAGSQAPPAQIVSSYQNALKDAPTPEARAELARAYAVSLTERDRLALARALASGTRQDDAVFGAGLLVDGGRLKEAAPVFARFVTGGGDMTAHFWKWTHGDNPKTAPRAYIAIARARSSPSTRRRLGRGGSSWRGTARTRHRPVRTVRSSCGASRLSNRTPTSTAASSRSSDSRSRGDGDG